MSAAEYELGCPCCKRQALMGRGVFPRCPLTWTEIKRPLVQTGRKRRRQFVPWIRSRKVPRPPYPKGVPFS